MANDKILSKITHALVIMTKDKKVAEQTGIHGVLFLCFGPEDSDCISQIHLVKSGDRFAWRPPHVEVYVDNKVKRLPVFKGRAGEELGTAAQGVYETIKKQFGRVRYGHRYRVANSKAVDETPEE